MSMQFPGNLGTSKFAYGSKDYGKAEAKYNNLLDKARSGQIDDAGLKQLGQLDKDLGGNAGRKLDGMINSGQIKKNDTDVLQLNNILLHPPGGDGPASVRRTDTKNEIIGNLDDKMRTNSKPGGARKSFHSQGGPGSPLGNTSPLGNA